MAKPQVNVLLSQEERDLLEAVAFVDEVTASELLRPVVAAYLNKQRNDPNVKAALTALKNRRARKEGKLSDLRHPIAKDAGADQ
jgi:hypothetical protein